MGATAASVAAVVPAPGTLGSAGAAPDDAAEARTLPRGVDADAGGAACADLDAAVGVVATAVAAVAVAAAAAAVTAIAVAVAVVAVVVVAVAAAVVAAAVVAAAVVAAAVVVAPDAGHAAALGDAAAPGAADAADVADVADIGLDAAELLLPLCGLRRTGFPPD